MSDLAACRSCGQEMIWCISPAGKRLPLDARPVDQLPEPWLKTLYWLHRDGTVLHAERWLGDPATLEHTLYASHFATCVNAAQHSRR